jgi:hypothetical protein
MPSIMLIGTAGPGREAPAQDGADIGFARIDDDAFLEAACGFHGLAIEQARADLLDQRLVGVLGGHRHQARPDPARCFF